MVISTGGRLTQTVSTSSKPSTGQLLRTTLKELTSTIKSTPTTSSMADTAWEPHVLLKAR